MQDILPSDQAQNFSHLALLAMKNDRRAFQSRLLVWTIYEIDPYWNSITFGDAHRLDQRDILMSEITQL
jgi:hypothetical protein